MSAAEDLSAQPRMIPLDLLDESPTNPRRHHNEAKDAELLESVRKHGVLQPVLARPNGKRFELVFGHRRLGAARAAELDAIPGTVREMDDLQVLEVQAIENRQREDVHPLDEAELFRRLHTDHGRSVDEIAAKVGLSRGYVYARLKLLDLAEPARKALEDGTIDASRALLIARLPSPKLQAEATEAITWKLRAGGREAMSFREAREEIERRFLLRTSETPWKLNDAELLPAAGPCSTCPKRSGNQTELFSDEEPKDLCLEPTCFEKKRAAHGKRLIAEAKASGAKVIAGGEAKKMFDQWGTFRAPTGFVRLDATCHDDPKSRSYRKLLKDAPIERTVVAGPKGEVVELVPQAGLKPALREAGHDFRNERPARSSAPSNRAFEEKRRRELELERQVLAGLAEAAPKLLGDLAGWRWLARAAIESTWHDTQKLVVARRGLEAEAPAKAKGKRARPLGPDDVLRRWIDEASLADVQGLVVELLLGRGRNDLHASSRRYAEQGPSPILDGAKLAGLDLAQLRSAIAREAAEKKKARGKKPSKKAKGKKKASA